ncbi:hypothetical protein ACOQFV_24525 [Nocardiopsis changdeensis]|uniref:Uncharacterized protein n=1 Tax=Nocardiopsis changdeensis TaxID=2831969 RepID=A0A975KTE1_9ACTN|nr:MULTISPECIES: hypothetical protein [Nocardiopsis]QUX26443.1 hypothetical protein KGD84_32615 [Nocardiopsis changdeensis]QYX40715.1 hypothetical protein K1J57_32465 [Nocardiopsis sp. MT53]
MDQLIAAAVRQGYQVCQDENGRWSFRRAGVAIFFDETPVTAMELLVMLNTLRGNGLIFPEE